MNLISFVDELVKLGGVKTLIKRGSDVSSSEIPAGMMSSAAPPPSIRVAPDEAGTRLESTHLPTTVEVGQLGPLGDNRRPIDRERFNRPYAERR